MMQEQAREEHAQEKSARYANKALEAAEKVLCKAFVVDPQRATLCLACRRHAMDHFAYETPKKLAREQVKRREAADLPPLHFTAEADLLKRIAALEAKVDGATKVLFFLFLAEKLEPISRSPTVEVQKEAIFDCDI